MADGTSHIDERHPETDAREILVRTPDDKSLRLSARHYDEDAWQVTLPFQAPVILINNSGNWKAQEPTALSDSMIQAIGSAIERSGDD